jgi:hypothetical protein
MFLTADHQIRPGELGQAGGEGEEVAAVQQVEEGPVVSRTVEGQLW